MSLTNYELIILCKFYNIELHGVFMKDELPKKQGIGNYIINLDSSTGNGTHWCCFIKSSNNDYLYFDSFGCVPPNSVSTFFKGKYGFNNWIIQDFKSNYCGFFCLGLFHHIAHDSSSSTLYEKANNYINMFKSNTLLNDNILRKYFKKLPYKNCPILISKLF